LKESRRESLVSRQRKIRLDRPFNFDR